MLSIETQWWMKHFLLTQADNTALENNPQGRNLGLREAKNMPRLGLCKELIQGFG